MNEQRQAQLRAGETFHALRVPRGVWTVLRLDGHGFSRLTRERYAKPFDARFHATMLHVAQTLLEEWHALYAWTASDEISLLLPLAWDDFDREVEKCVSLAASLASAAFTAHAGHRGHFDARVWTGSAEDVADYFVWRQGDAERCALNGYAYWLLRQKGQGAHATTRQLEGQNGAQLRALLRADTFDFEAAPAWQRRGVGMSWEVWEKPGFNPLLNAPVTAVRRRVKLWSDLPLGETYAQFVKAFLPLPTKARTNAGSPSLPLD